MQNKRLFFVITSVAVEREVKDKYNVQNRVYEFSVKYVIISCQ